MKDKIFGFAIIGCGAIARIHAEAIASLEDARLTAVFDQNSAQAAAFAREFSCRSYGTVEEMLADPDVDVVSICVPSGLHAKFAVMAANAGKHIVVEKPMAITAQQLEEMTHAVAENGVKITVIVQMRFQENVRLLKAAIDDGRLGRIYFADCRMRFYRSPEYYRNGGWRGTWEMDGGGALMNQGIHGIDLMQYLMGGVKSVYADCRTMARQIETEDAANLLVEYRNGAIGVIQGTTIAVPGEPRTITISGEKGTVVLQEDAIVRWDVEGERLATGETDVGSCQDPMAFSFGCHALQLRDLLDAIREDRPSAVDAIEGRKAVDLILAAYRSSQTGQKVLLPQEA